MCTHYIEVINRQSSPIFLALLLFGMVLLCGCNDSDDPEPMLVPTPPEPEVVEEEEAEPENAILRLNSGGGRLVLDSITFFADKYFQDSGQTYSNSNIDTIAGTDFDELYLTERSASSNLGDFNYAIPITNGTYTLNLHFAEIFHSAPGGSSREIGARLFSVSAEQNQILADYDIIADVGSQTATVKTFTVQVEDEELNLEFTATEDRPKLSGLEIFGDGSILQDSTCLWNDLAPSQMAKVEAQSVRIGDKLYVFAGFLEGLFITDVTEIYDVATDTWSLGAPMPTAVTHMGAVAVNNEVWIVGGFIGNHPGDATDKVQIYNTASDIWTDGPPLPVEIASGAAVFNNGKIHYFGGLLPDRVTDVGDHFVLDINDTSAGWQSVADLPDPRNHLGGAAIDGKVYAIGGQFGHDDGVQDQAFLDVYDPSTNTWSRLADLPNARSHFEPGTIVHNGSIIIVGGRRGSFFYDAVTQYDPQTDTWSELCVLPEKNLAPAAKVFGDSLLVANGGEAGTCCPLKSTKWLKIK